MSTQTDQSTTTPAVDDEPQQVQSPLTLVMPLKSKQAAEALRAALMQPGGIRQRIEDALNALGTVHFARFVLLDGDPPQLAVITTFDDEFEDYILSFVGTPQATDRLGPVFDLILTNFVVDPPATPVAENAAEFVAYVKQHNADCVGSFYSAYPLQRVFDIKRAAAAAS